MGVKRKSVYQWKKETQASAILSRLARALGIEAEPGWKIRLAETLKVSQNVLSQWANRGKIPSEYVISIMKMMEEKHLPNVFMESDARIFLTGEAIEKWPVLEKLAAELNMAATKSDHLLACSMLQYALDKIKAGNRDF